MNTHPEREPPRAFYQKAHGLRDRSDYGCERIARHGWVEDEPRDCLGQEPFAPSEPTTPGGSKPSIGTDQEDGRARVLRAGSPAAWWARIRNMASSGDGWSREGYRRLERPDSVALATHAMEDGPLRPEKGTLQAGEVRDHGTIELRAASALPTPPGTYVAT